GVVPNHRVPLFDLASPHLVDALLVGSRRCRITPKAHWEGSRTVTDPHCRHSIHVPFNTPPSTSMSVRSLKVFPQMGHSAMTVPPLRRSRGPRVMLGAGTGDVRRVCAPGTSAPGYIG